MIPSGRHSSSTGCAPAEEIKHQPECYQCAVRFYFILENNPILFASFGTLQSFAFPCGRLGAALPAREGGWWQGRAGHGGGTGVSLTGTVASLGEGVWVCLPCPAPPTPCRANAAPLPPLSPLLPPALWLLPRIAAAAECGFIALLCEGKCERVIKDGKSQNFKPEKVIKDGISKNFKTN